MKAKLLLAVLTAVACVAFAVAFTCSCSQSVPDNAEIIDVRRPTEVQLLDLADSFRIVQLDENKDCFGEITLAKVYGDDIFLQDFSLRKIYHFNKDGSLLNVLDSKGRAKSEYLDIESFAYSPEKGLLYILSRSTMAIKVYSVSDMCFRYDIPLGRYMNAVETLSDNTLFAVQSEGLSSGGALVTIDMETGAITEIMNEGLREDQWEYMENSCLYRMEDGSISLCIPGYPNRIMRCTADGVEEMGSFVMKGSPLNKKFWSLSADDESSFSYAINQRYKNPNACLVPYLAVQGDTGVSTFWALTGNRFSILGFAMNLYSKGKMYKPLLPDGSLIKVFGLSAEGEYLILVETKQIKDYLNEEVKSEHSLLFCRF